MKQLAPALAVLTFALALALPARADDEPAPPPADVSSSPAPEVRYPPSSVRVKLIIGGLAISGLAYAAAVGTASNWPEVPGSAGLKAPFVGPWIALAQSGCAPDDANCGAKVYVRGAAYVLDGIVQIAGLGLIAEGIFMKTESPTAPQKKPSLALGLPGGITMHPLPMVSARYTGLGIVGTF